MSVGIAGAAALAGMVLAGSAGAQAGKTSGGKPSGATPTQVTVEGRRKEASDRIDRRVYDVSRDPDAATGTGADILNKLPSVQVAPSVPG